MVRYIHSNNGELVHRPEYNDPTDPEKQTHMCKLDSEKVYDYD